MLADKCTLWSVYSIHCVYTLNSYLGTVALFFTNFIWNAAWTQRSSQPQGLPWLWDSRSMKNMTLFLYWTLQRKLPQSEIWSWSPCHLECFCFIIWQKGKKITHSTAFLLTHSKFNINKTWFFFFCDDWKEFLIQTCYVKFLTQSKKLQPTEQIYKCLGKVFHNWKLKQFLIKR